MARRSGLCPRWRGVGRQGGSSGHDAFPFTEDLPFYGQLAAAQGGRVLELGYGSGRVLLSLAQAGHEIVEMDVSSPMLALAREKLAAAGAEVATPVLLLLGRRR